jgi:hypothetical protein
LVDPILSGRPRSRRYNSIFNRLWDIPGIEGNGDWVVRARIREGPPARWGAIAGDAIHNLRAALDIMWRLAMYPRGGGQADRRTEFRIYDTEKEFEASQRNAIKRGRKPAVELYRSLKP